MMRALPEFDLRIRPDGPPSTQTARPAGVWRRADGIECGRSFLAGSASILDWEGLGRFQFTDSTNIVAAWPHAGIDETSVRTQFAREIAPILLQARGWEALHASAVGTAQDAMVLCGASGSGKSTFAYALAASGRTQWADDHVVLDCGSDSPTIYARPFNPRLRPPSLDYFGSIVTPPTPAGTARLAQVVALQQVPSLERSFAIERVSQTRAFTTLLPHAHCFDPADADAVARMTRHYLQIAATVPVYHLRYRPSFTAFPDILEALATLADAPPAF